MFVRILKKYSILGPAFVLTLVSSLYAMHSGRQCLGVELVYSKKGNPEDLSEVRTWIDINPSFLLQLNIGGKMKPLWSLDGENPFPNLLECRCYQLSRMDHRGELFDKLKKRGESSILIQNRIIKNGNSRFFSLWWRPRYEDAVLNSMEGVSNATIVDFGAGKLFQTLVVLGKKLNRCPSACLDVFLVDKIYSDFVSGQKNDVIDVSEKIECPKIWRQFVSFFSNAYPKAKLRFFSYVGVNELIADYEKREASFSKPLWLLGADLDTSDDDWKDIFSAKKECCLADLNDFVKLRSFFMENSKIKPTSVLLAKRGHGHVPCLKTIGPKEFVQEGTYQRINNRHLASIDFSKAFFRREKYMTKYVFSTTISENLRKVGWLKK